MNQNNDLANAISYSEFWSQILKYKNYSVEKVNRYLRPKHRSSTIFPVYLKDKSKCYIGWLTYWVKKHGNKVAIRTTARNIDGQKVGVRWQPIVNFETNILSARDFEYFNFQDFGFCGTIEVEVFTEYLPKFTFPAMSLFYKNEISSAVVHSCIRFYNKDEVVNDYAIKFPQTGFDVSLGEKKKNYICFMGDSKTKYFLKLTLEFLKKKFVREVTLINSCRGKLHIIYIEEVFNCDNISSLAKVKINHNLDVFPRFYVGTLRDGFVPTLTHTFFDTSPTEIKGRASEVLLRVNNINKEKYYDSSFIVPIFPIQEFDISLRTYSQNLIFLGSIEIKVFNLQGNLLFLKKLMDRDQKVWNSTYTFKISRLLSELNLDNKKKYSIFFGFDSVKKSFPKRFKMGLNLNKKSTNEKIGTNICFAPSVQYETIFDKPFTRRWFPIGGDSNYVGTLHLTSLEKKPILKKISIHIEFINFNGKKLVKKILLNPYSSLFIDISEDRKLSEFFGKEIGWCFVNCNYYMLDAYFFSTNGEQISGDHAF